MKGIPLAVFCSCCRCPSLSASSPSCWMCHHGSRPVLTWMEGTRGDSRMCFSAEVLAFVSLLDVNFVPLYAWGCGKDTWNTDTVWPGDIEQTREKLGNWTVGRLPCFSQEPTYTLQPKRSFYIPAHLTCFSNPLSSDAFPCTGSLMPGWKLKQNHPYL